MATSAGTAPPWYYVIVGVVARGLSSGSDVMGYRMAAVLLCAVILGYAMARSQRRGRGGWLLVAITPSAWFLFGVVGTSGVEIAFVALALVEAVNRFDDPQNSISVNRVTFPLAACLLLRPAALVDVLVVALVLIPTLVRPITKKQMMALAWPFAIVAARNDCVESLVGLRPHRPSNSRFGLTHDSSPSVVARDSDDGPPGNRRARMERVLRACAGANRLGCDAGRGGVLDRETVARSLVARALDRCRADRSDHRRGRDSHPDRRSLAGPILDPVRDGRRLVRSAECGATRPLLRTFVVAAVCAEVLTLWQTLRRYMVGLDGSLVLRDPKWEPPLNPWLLLAVNTTAIAWLGAVALGSGDDVPEDVDDVVGRSGVVV